MPGLINIAKLADSAYLPDDYEHAITTKPLNTYIWIIAGLFVLFLIVFVIIYFTKKDTPSPSPSPCNAGLVPSPCTTGPSCILPCKDNETYNCDTKECMCNVTCGDNCCEKGKTCKVVQVCQ